MTEKSLKNSKQYRSKKIADTEMCFILGIKQRCGTNMLKRFLGLHPECNKLGPIWEDFVVHYSELLENYVDRLYKRYKLSWKVEERIGPPELLLNYFGDAIIKYLKIQNECIPHKTIPVSLVTKTPSVKGMHNFFKMFPKARLLILIRDGRAVVESGVKSFNWNFEDATREWASAAKTIIDFQQKYSKHEYNYLIVKYEDLIADQDKELRKIFSFLNLDAEKYDFSQARSMKVFGSSEISKKDNGKIDWDGEKKTPNFNPLNRWDTWERAKHERFNWIAGKYLSLLDYTPKEYLANPIFYKAWNGFLDLKWRITNYKEFVKRSS